MDRKDHKRYRKLEVWARDNSLRFETRETSTGQWLVLGWHRGSFIGRARTIQVAIDLACSRRLAFDDAEYKRLLSI